MFDPSKPFEEVEAGFDPSKPFEGVTTANNAAPAPGDEGFWGKLGAFGLGAVQGATSNFADEIGAGFKTAQEVYGNPNSFGDEYRKNVKEIRAGYEGFKDDHPWAYGGGQMLGATPTALVMPGVAGAVRQGAASMVGESDYDYTGGTFGQGAVAMAKDAGIGAGAGAAGYGIGQAAGPALNRGWEYGKKALGYGMQAPQLAVDTMAQPIGRMTRSVTDKLTPDDPGRFSKLSSSIVKGAQRDLETADDMLAGPSGAAAQKVIQELGDASNKTFAQLSDLARQRLFSAYRDGLVDRGLNVTREFVADSLPQAIAGSEEMAGLSVKQIVRELNKRDLQYGVKMMSNIDNNFGATARQAGIPLNPNYEQAAQAARSANSDFMAGNVNRMQVPNASQPGVFQQPVKHFEDVAAGIDKTGKGSATFANGATKEQEEFAGIYSQYGTDPAKWPPWIKLGFNAMRGNAEADAKLAAEKAAGEAAKKAEAEAETSGAKALARHESQV